MVFGLFVFFQLFFALASRSLRHTLVRVGILTNKILLYSLVGETLAVLLIMNHPVLQQAFDFAPLGISDWAIMISLATTGFVFTEVTKALRQRGLFASFVRS
jgi:Ca2+-transporting ATPase